MCIDKTLSKIKKRKFCNSSCAAIYNNKRTPRNHHGNCEKNTPNHEHILDRLTDDDIVRIYNSSYSITDFSNKLGYRSSLHKRGKNVNNRLNRLGIDLSIFPIKRNNSPKNCSYKTHCTICGKEIYKNKYGYCQHCYNEMNKNNKIRKWLETGDTGCFLGSNIRNCIRNYIYESQNYKCAICHNPNIWNGKEIKFVLDHIDGNAANNIRDNLRLICPNCDSQLDTFKSKNKNSARSFRRKYYMKNN